MANLRALMSAAVGTMMSRARLGGDLTTYDGKRDMYSALGYARTISPQDYRDRYARDGVAARIVEAFPSACWRGGGRVYEDEDPTVTTTFEKAWDALNERMNMWGTFRALDVVTGIGRYGILVIGAPGNMAEPLDTATADEVMYLQPYGEDLAPVETLDTDGSSPRFGLPIFYRLQPQTSTPGQSTRVHHSRVIHVAEGLLDNRVYGQPRLEKVWNDLDSLVKVHGGGAEAYWKRCDQGLQIAVDPEMDLDADAIGALENQIENYTHGLARIVRTRGVTMKALGSDVADFAGPVSALMDILSAGTGIPQRILMGSERGQLASSQDQSNWDTRVSDRRADFCAAKIVRPFVDRLIALGALPTPTGYGIAWPDMDEMTEAEKVTVAVTLATMPQASGTIIMAAEIRESYLGLPPLTPEQRS